MRILLLFLFYSSALFAAAASSSSAGSTIAKVSGGYIHTSKKLSANSVAYYTKYTKAEIHKWPTFNYHVPHHPDMQFQAGFIASIWQTATPKEWTSPDLIDVAFLFGPAFVKTAKKIMADSPDQLLMALNETIINLEDALSTKLLNRDTAFRETHPSYIRAVSFLVCYHNQMFTTSAETYLHTTSRLPMIGKEITMVDPSTRFELKLPKLSGEPEPKADIVWDPSK